MTRLARAGKCGGFGNSGSAAAADGPVVAASASREVSPRNPKPQAASRSIARRDNIDLGGAFVIKERMSI
jgi:hypothetical protein